MPKVRRVPYSSYTTTHPEPIWVVPTIGDPNISTLKSRILIIRTPT